jgi:hypothetical protein
MTPSDLELAARNRYNAIGDPHFSTDMIMDIIYQACLQMSTESMIIEQTYSTTSTLAIREYSYPTNAMAIRRIEYNGKKLRYSDLEDDPKTSINEVSGTPSCYAIWKQELILYPTPDTTGDTIKVYTYNRPARVTSSSVLEIPEELHMDILDLILSVMYAKDQNNVMATYHRNLWEQSLVRIKRHQMKKKSGDEFHVTKDSDFVEYGVIL